MVSNPVQSLVSANYIGVLVWAVLFGIGLRGASETTKTMFDEGFNRTGKGSYLDHQLRSVRYHGSGIQHRF